MRIQLCIFKVYHINSAVKMGSILQNIHSGNNKAQRYLSKTTMVIKFSYGKYEIV